VIISGKGEKYMFLNKEAKIAASNVNEKEYGNKEGRNGVK